MNSTFHKESLEPAPSGGKWVCYPQQGILGLVVWCGGHNSLYPITVPGFIHPSFEFGELRHFKIVGHSDKEAVGLYLLCYL